MIRVDRLTKTYGEKVAVSDVSFQVGSGEILGFLGPNGAGKTTTMRILAGYMPATAGVAEIAGHDVFSQSLEARRCVGYLPENVPLYPEMTVRSYLEYMAKLKGVAGKARRQRIGEVAERCRVSDVLDSRIGKLSKGYRQRVGLAQALVHDPKVLILDEPTVGLDPRQITETRALIKSLGGDHTVILSTHILPEVSMTCSRVIVVNEGRLVAQDTVENLTHRGAAQAIQIEVRGPGEEVVRRLRAIPDVLRVKGPDAESRYSVECAVGRDLRESIARAVVESGWGLLELRPTTVSLEDVFLRLTTSEPTDETGDSPADAPREKSRASAGGSRKGQRKGGVSA